MFDARPSCPPVRLAYVYRAMPRGAQKKIYSRRRRRQRARERYAESTEMLTTFTSAHRNVGRFVLFDEINKKMPVQKMYHVQPEDIHEGVARRHVRHTKEKVICEHQSPKGL